MSIATVARKALSLQKDPVFRLLVVMTALLGWVTAMGLGGLVMLQQTYQSWELNQASQFSVYLRSDASAQTMANLVVDLETRRGVEKVEKMTDGAVTALLTPLLGDDVQKQPLPQVFNLTLHSTADRDALRNRVLQDFPTAEFDDGNQLVADVGALVRAVQWAAAALVTILLLIMGLLVALTVRAGLRGQKRSLSIMQYVGATDSFLELIVVRQVLWRSLLGWVGALLLIAVSCAALWSSGILAGALFNPLLLATVALGPLLLTLTTLIVSWTTAGWVIRK